VNKELLHLIEQLCREKGIEKAVLIEAVLSAVLSAARKRFGTAEHLDARFDEATGMITLFSPKEVVAEDDLADENVQISLEEARAIDPHAVCGDTIEVRYDLEDFGRIAAQTAKQVIIQKVREAERDMVYREFHERQGELVNGIVARAEREGNLIVDLGKTEALLPRREQSFRETFRRGDRIRAYIIEVKRSSSGHQVILSRTHPGFLIRLFELEVPEIYENIVEIQEAVRDPSGRAKIAVVSHDKDVDPIGACVGMKGMRVQAVVQELRGEKIDIIQWSNDPEQFVRNALSPAKVTRVYVNTAEKAMQVIVPEDQLSLAIGKRGQNVRLAAKLTHWRIDIKSESETDADMMRQEALRRAEMAFQTPQRLATEALTAAADIAQENATASDNASTATEALLPSPAVTAPEVTSHDPPQHTTRQSVEYAEALSPDAAAPDEACEDTVVTQQGLSTAHEELAAPAEGYETSHETHS
jgi:transcription termination/antitermination protein NusA